MRVQEDVRSVEAVLQRLRWVGTVNWIAASVFLVLGVLEVRVMLICAAAAWLLLSIVSTVLTRQARRLASAPQASCVERTT